MPCLSAFAPMRETRVYGKGGQFAKGGGRILGKGDATMAAAATVDRRIVDYGWSSEHPAELAAAAERLNHGQASGLTGRKKRDFEEAVQEWTGSRGPSNYQSLDEGLQAAYNGRQPSSPRAAVILKLAEASSPAPVPLHRGLRLNSPDAVAFAESLQPGSHVDLPVASWSSNRRIAEDFAFAHTLAHPNWDSLVLTVNPGARAVRIDKIKGDYQNQAEWIASGQMRVVERTIEGRVVNVVLEPVGNDS